MAGALQRWRVRQKEKGVRQRGGARGEVAGMEGHEEIRERESTAEM